MKKKVFGRKLSRSRPAREALFASLARAVILKGSIDTTEAKAKAVRGELEKMVTMGKTGTLADRRRILARLDNAKDALDALFKKVIPVFSARKSGYIRLTSLPRRLGDNAKIVRMEWTEKIEMGDKKEEKRNKKETKQDENVSTKSKRS